MKIALTNYALPEPDPDGLGTRFWHKAGSRWPATLLNRKNDGSEYFPWPFFLCYLKSMLQQEGHEVELIDACFRKWSLDRVEQHLCRTAPDFIVFETSEQTEKGDIQILDRIGVLAPVLLVGPNVTAEHTAMLSWPGCRAAISGEYLLSVVEYFRAPTDGLVSGRELLGREQMDALPFAYRDPELFPCYNSRFKTTPPGIQGHFVSMWGCHHRCKFCIWTHSYWPKSSQLDKQFSLDRLTAELDRLIVDFPGVTSLYDDADNHKYRGDDAFAFAEMMGRRGLPWAVLTRADTYMKKSGSIDWNVWQAYRDNGCYAVKIGVEGVQEVMDLTGKRLSEDVVREFVPGMQALGISVYASFMLGVPGSTPELDRKTMNLIKELAGSRPELFEYLLSYCDVTRSTPLFQDSGETDYRHDGQLTLEYLVRRGKVLFPPVNVDPVNL